MSEDYGTVASADEYLSEIVCDWRDLKSELLKRSLLRDADNADLVAAVLLLAQQVMFFRGHFEERS